MEAISASTYVAFEEPMRKLPWNCLACSCICEPEVQERDLSMRHAGGERGLEERSQGCSLGMEKRVRHCAGLRNESEKMGLALSGNLQSGGGGR